MQSAPSLAQGCDELDQRDILRHLKYVGFHLPRQVCGIFYHVFGTAYRIASPHAQHGKELHITCQVHQGELAMHAAAVRQAPLHSQRDQAVRAAAGSILAGGCDGAPGQPLLRQRFQLTLGGNRNLSDNHTAWSES